MFLIPIQARSSQVLSFSHACRLSPPLSFTLSIRLPFIFIFNCSRSDRRKCARELIWNLWRFCVQSWIECSLLLRVFYFIGTTAINFLFVVQHRNCQHDWFLFFNFKYGIAFAFQGLSLCSSGCWSGTWADTIDSDFLYKLIFIGKSVLLLWYGCLSWLQSFW